MQADAAGPIRPETRGHAFWWRLTDNLFRRLGWFILPVVVMTLIGFQQSRQTLELYSANATLSASTNPLIPAPTIGGATAQWWETPAQATSRIINEQMGTDAFVSAVADTAGLGDAVDAGYLGLGVIRANVWADTRGDVTLSVNAQWLDPQTAYNLVGAVVTEYQNYLTETISSNSSDAETYFEQQLARDEKARDDAEQALTDFIASLPPLASEDQYPLPTQFRLNTMSDDVTAAQSQVSATRQQLDEARIARSEKATAAGRSFRVVDEPSVPRAPASTMKHRVMTVAAFMMFGVVISAGALLLTTVLDHTVASTADLLVLDGVALVATVPELRIGSRRRRPRSFGRRSRRPAMSAGAG